MIQRFQTLFLLLGCLAVAAMFLFDAAWPGGQTDVPGWMPGALVAAAFLTISTAVWAILLYKDRERQYKVVLYAQFLTIACIIVMLVGLWQAQELSQMVAGPDGPWKLIAVLLPFLGYVLFRFARRAIARDIQMIRSVDRLR